MLKRIATLLAGAALIALSGAAAARVDVGISIGIPAPVYMAPRPPVAYYPAPVYAPPPQVYYAPAPVYYAPPPVYYGAPVVVNRGWHRGWRHQHGHRW
jgi:hypothetical protein